MDGFLAFLVRILVFYPIPLLVFLAVIVLLS